MIKTETIPQSDILTMPKCTPKAISQHSNPHLSPKSPLPSNQKTNKPQKARTGKSRTSLHSSPQSSTKKSPRSTQKRARTSKSKRISSPSSKSLPIEVTATNKTRKKIGLSKYLKADLSATLPNQRLNTAYFSQIADIILDKFYPVYCKPCNTPMTVRLRTRSYVARCPHCKAEASRLSRTPFVHLKLPLWMLGFAIDQSLISYPNVLTGAALKRHLGITESSALRLKRRLQVFASEQKDSIRQLMKNELSARYSKRFKLPLPDSSDIDIDITKKLKDKRIPQTDAMVLFSARERANKGRKRFRKHGQTASIYLSDSLGGRQVGTLVQGFTWKGGPTIYESISDQKAATLLPLIEQNIPKQCPLFSDMGLKWYKKHNKNHRTVNHNLKSKRGNGRSRRRWQQNGIHSQAIESQNGVLKTAFRQYRYIRPEYSQLYLNEFSLWGAIRYYGLESIATLGKCDNFYQTNNLNEKAGVESVGVMLIFFLLTNHT